VALIAADGSQVAGALFPDGDQWTASAPLGYAGRYTWSGLIVAPGGSTTPLTGSFRTLAPSRLVHATTNQQR
jgi:Bacterial Ig domain